MEERTLTYWPPGQNTEHQIKQEDTVRPSELFDRFVEKSVTAAEIAAMDVAVLTRQIAEMRADEPDDIDMTDAEIAKAILSVA